MASFPIRVAMERTGLSARQIRHYEALGLVMPGRSGGGQRLYRPEDIRRLIQIRDMVHAGVGLSSVRQLMAAAASEEAEPRFAGAASVPTSLYPVLDRAEMERLVALHEQEEDEQ